jgi:hypothetical protein
MQPTMMLMWRKQKHMAKCVVTTLTDAGFEIVLKDSKPKIAD